MDRGALCLSGNSFDPPTYNDATIRVTHVNTLILYSICYIYRYIEEFLNIIEDRYVSAML